MDFLFNQLSHLLDLPRRFYLLPSLLGGFGGGRGPRTDYLTSLEEYGVLRASRNAESTPVAVGRVKHERTIF